LFSFIICLSWWRKYRESRHPDLQKAASYGFRRGELGNPVGGEEQLDS
jgi:hypothetical protein